MSSQKQTNLKQNFKMILQYDKKKINNIKRKCLSDFSNLKSSKKLFEKPKINQQAKESNADQADSAGERGSIEY